jgi:hypothetical protein
MLRPGVPQLDDAMHVIRLDRVRVQADARKVLRDRFPSGRRHDASWRKTNHGAIAQSAE